MPISYRIDKERGVVFTVAEGVLTGAEMLEHKRKLLEDPDCCPGIRELSDLRNIISLDISTHDVSEMSLRDALYADRLKENRLAIVTNDDLTFGMARMYQSMAQKDTLQISIFRDMPSARNWLGLPEGE